MSSKGINQRDCSISSITLGSIRLAPKGRPHAWLNGLDMISETRRNFIKRIVPVTAMLGSTTGCQRLRVTERNEIDRGAIEKLRGALKGRLILPTDSSYESERRVFYW